MKHIAYIPLCPLGEVICCMNQLERIKEHYSPCRLTVFAVPLIAQLLANYTCVDEVVVLKGNVRGELDLSGFVPPSVEYDAVFNMSYHLSGLELQKRLKCRMRYGGESFELTEELCRQNFDRWVSDEYWREVTLKRYGNVCGQLGEILRLAIPEYDCPFPVLSPETYAVEPCPEELPDGMVLFMPGTSGLAKYWPIGKYLAVAKCLERLGRHPVFVIGPQDRRLLPALQSCGFPVLDTLPLPQLADAILHADLVIGNDSGPMHFAAAFQRPTLHIFASAAAFNWYPYREPLHTLVMPECGGAGERLACGRFCIGGIPVERVLAQACRKLGLSAPPVRHVAFLVQDRIGDSLMAISNIEEAAKIYAPCRMTVFAPEGMLPFYQAYAFADQCIPLQGEKTAIPDVRFDAVFNQRYDRESAQVVRKLKYNRGYGYENTEIPEEVCQSLYTGGYLPLSLWDDVRLRRYTSVTEQAACLIRLVEPEFHCQHPVLGENTLAMDMKEVQALGQPRKSVLLVPGGSYRAKCWSLEKFLRLAGECIVPRGFTPFFILGPEEREHISRIREAGYLYAFCPSLSQIAGLAVQWLTSRGMAVGNDTGVMHLLKIMGCHSITISAHSAHFTWEPYERQRHVVIYPECSDVGRCAQCYDSGCLEKIPYGEVEDALAQKLEMLAAEY